MWNRRTLKWAYNPATVKGRSVHNVQSWCARASRLGDGRASASIYGGSSCRHIRRRTEPGKITGKKTARIE